MNKGVKYRSENILRRHHYYKDVVHSYKDVVHSTDSGITKAISSKEDQLLQQAIEKERSIPKKKLLQYMKTVLNIQENPDPETQDLDFKDKTGNDSNITLTKYPTGFVLQLNISGIGLIEIHRDTENNTLSYHNTIGKQEEIKQLRTAKENGSYEERQQIREQEEELMHLKPLSDEVLSKKLLPFFQEYLTYYKTYEKEYKKKKKEILNNPKKYPLVHRFNHLLSLCQNRQTDNLYDIEKAYTDENEDTILIQMSLSFDGGTIGYSRKKRGQQYYDESHDLFYDYYSNSFVGGFGFGGLRSSEEIEDILSTCENFILKDPEFNKQQNNQGNNR